PDRIDIFGQYPPRQQRLVDRDRLPPFRWARTMTRYVCGMGKLRKNRTLLAAGASLALAAFSLPARAQSQDAASAAKGPAATYVLVGAGDIASCKYPEGAQATAKLIEKIPGTVWAAGDLAYERGSSAEFKNCYDTTWGKFKDRTRPTPGNHEYADPGAAAYF